MLRASAGGGFGPRGAVRRLIHPMTMKRPILLFFGLLLAATAAQAQRTIDLSGRWRFAIDRSDSDTAPANCSDSIELPGSMLTNRKGDPVTVDTRWTGSLYDSSYYFNPRMERYRQPGNLKFPFFLTPEFHYTGTAWYSRTVEVPADWQGREVVLLLERPHIETTLFVNGAEVGHQMSLSVPHQYDVTPYVRFGQPNELTIRVYNGIENVCVGADSHSVTDQTQGNWNGIAGRIELQARPLIRRLRVAPHIADRTAEIFVNDTVFRVQLPQDAALWDEFNPVLHTVEVVYRGDTIPVTFGLREITVAGNRLLLNGRPIRLRATVENCCFPETGYPPTDVASWERIIRICKAWGLNAMRFHSFCPPDAAFEAADRLGFYLQPEGPSWPNHGVKLRAGMPIDDYLLEECRAIVDHYGAHPSFVMLAAGNEPAGDWVAWGRDFNAAMRAYDPSRLYATASVGGGWAWDEGSQFHVKGGARGLDWNRRAPQSDDDFDAAMRHPIHFPATPEQPFNTEPYISHETGQWCAFPDLKEVDQYTGVYRARNFEIFGDLLRENGMGGLGDAFLEASGKLQVLVYKYDIERNLRTTDYAGFQLLALNDYSGQGTALVGPLNVHWNEKGYCTAAEWREFCSEVVPLARFPKFVYTDAEPVEVATQLCNFSPESFDRLAWRILTERGDVAASGELAVGDTIRYRPSPVGELPRRLTLELTAGTHRNHWEFWVYPAALPDAPEEGGPYITDRFDDRARAVLVQGGDVLLLAAGRIRYGNDVKHSYLPVFWNTSWFKMRPPHTTGSYIRAEHPVFGSFPTDTWQNLNWWELVNDTQVMNLAHFPADFQPIVQPIDTWHLSRKLGMLLEARVLGGRLLLTTIDLTTDLDRRVVARQLRRSVLQYMQSDAFRPQTAIPDETIDELFTHEAPAVDLFTRESPDELKPALKPRDGTF